MSTSLASIAAEYHRITRLRDEENYDNYFGSHVDYLKKRISETKRVSVPLTVSTNATLPPTDLLIANGMGEGAFCKLYQMYANLQENGEVGTGIFQIQKDDLEAFFTIAFRANGIAPTSNVGAPSIEFSVTSSPLSNGSATTRVSIEDSRPWIRFLYERVRLGETSKALRLIYACMEDHLQNKEFSALAEILAEIDVERLNPSTMTAVLRICGRFRNKLPSWHGLLQRVKSRLSVLRVPNVQGILIGLE